MPPGARKFAVDTVDQLLAFRSNPLGFVWWAYPWGVPGSGLEPTEDDPHPGPDKWQTEFLEQLGEDIRNGVKNPRFAVAAGNGPGKSAVMAWLTQWAISCWEHPQIIVTANTETQLMTTTWRELAVWHERFILKDWFEYTATRYKFKDSPETWFAAAIPWSEARAQAFAGKHEKAVFIFFDEASEIADIIWQKVEGAQTQKNAFWFAFGNPTQNVGRFRQCWTTFRKRWRLWNIDTRTCKRIENKDIIAAWIEDYGEDSDFVRIHVRGQFPRSSEDQFISSEAVEAALARKIDRANIPLSIPRVMAWDIGGGGASLTVGGCRQGRLLLPDSIKRFSIGNQMLLASHIATELNEWNPDICFIDANGPGGGVYDRLIQLGYTNVVAVYWGDTKMVTDELRYYNQRAECWDRMRMWLERDGSIPNDRQLQDDLIGPKRCYDNRHRMLVEKKEVMARRGIPSPDTADMLALTFAHPIPVKRDDAEAQGFAEPED